MYIYIYIYIYIYVCIFVYIYICLHSNDVIRISRPVSEAADHFALPDTAHFECCSTLRPVAARCTVCFSSGNDVCAHGCSERFWGAWRTTVRRPCPKWRYSNIVDHPRPNFRQALLFPLRTLRQTSSYCLVCCLRTTAGSPFWQNAVYVRQRTSMTVLTPSRASTYGYRLWRQKYKYQHRQRCRARQACILTEHRQERVERVKNAIVSGKR